MSWVMECFKAYKFVQKSFDLIFPFFYSLIIIAIDFSFGLKGRNKISGIVVDQNISQPINIVSFSGDFVVCEIGGDG